MPMLKISTTIYRKQDLEIKQIADMDNNLYWCVCDKQSNILYRHQDKDIAFAFAHQHNKMLKAEQMYKEMTNA